MLGEYTDVKNDLLTLLDLRTQILENTAVDTLSLDAYMTYPTELASEAFVPTGDHIPAKYIALKEAFDFTSSLARMGAIFSMDRADYYSEATTENALEQEALSQLDASVKKTASLLWGLQLMDIRLYSSMGQYQDSSECSEEMWQASLSSECATRLETIAGKVVKYMLTTKGSDFFDSDYGSYLTSYRQIADAYIPRIQLELEADLSSCTSFIQAAENAELDDDEERLSSVKLVSLEYDRDTDPTRFDVYLLITTSFGNTAQLTVTS